MISTTHPHGTALEPPLPGDAVVIRRPHFQLRGGSLFFLISRHPMVNLNESEQALWSLLGEDATVEAIRARLGTLADQTMRSLIDYEVAEVVLPAPLRRRRRVMVIEPHMDDATLSVGGAMLQRRADCEFLIVTMATQSIASSYQDLHREFFDVETISGLRKAESAIVARLLWGQHIPLGLVEASLRYHPQNWTLDWFRRHEYAIYNYLEHFALPGELEQWTSTLTKAIANLQPDEIWMPLGVGIHVDHQLTLHACLNIMRDNPRLVQGCVCRFFQDVPYAAVNPGHTAAVLKALIGAGATLEEERVDITATMREKRHLISIFASQWKIQVIQVKVEACAKSLGKSPEYYGELLYRVADPPRKKIAMLATSAARDSVHRVECDVTPWFRRNRFAPVIGLLLVAPVGHWAVDIKSLLEYFPDAHLEVHMQTKFAAHAEMFTSPRVSIHLGGNRWAWLFKDGLPTTLTRRLPLVIIAGRRREMRGRWFARVGVLSDAVASPTTSDFILALQCAAKGNTAAGAIVESGAQSDVLTEIGHPAA